MATATKFANSKVITAAGEFTPELRIDNQNGEQNPVIRLHGDFTGAVELQAKRPDQPDTEWQTIRSYTEQTVPPEELRLKGHWNIRLGVPDGGTFAGEVLAEVG